MLALASPLVAAYPHVGHTGQDTLAGAGKVEAQAIPTVKAGWLAAEPLDSCSDACAKASLECVEEEVSQHDTDVVSLQEFNKLLGKLNLPQCTEQWDSDKFGHNLNVPNFAVSNYETKAGTNAVYCALSSGAKEAFSCAAVPFQQEAGGKPVGGKPSRLCYCSKAAGVRAMTSGDPGTKTESPLSLEQCHAYSQENKNFKDAYGSEHTTKADILQYFKVDHKVLPYGCQFYVDPKFPNYNRFVFNEGNQFANSIHNTYFANRKDTASKICPPGNYADNWCMRSYSLPVVSHDDFVASADPKTVCTKPVSQEECVKAAKQLNPTFMDMHNSKASLTCNGGDCTAKGPTVGHWPEIPHGCSWTAYEVKNGWERVVFNTANPGTHVANYMGETNELQPAGNAYVSSYSMPICDV